MYFLTATSPNDNKFHSVVIGGEFNARKYPVTVLKLTVADVGRPSVFEVNGKEHVDDSVTWRVKTGR